MTAIEVSPPSVGSLLQTISPSRLACWQQCRLKFWFRYLSGIHKPKSAALALGSAVHGTLKMWNKARWHGHVPGLKEIYENFLTAWTSVEAEEQVDWNESEISHKATAWRLVETYLRETPIPLNERVEAVEASAEADLSAHGLPVLRGILDLVRAGGRIVDFKTSGRTPDVEQVLHTTEAQTTSYALLYRVATGQSESGIEIHTLVKTKSPKLAVHKRPPASEKQVTRLYRGIESYTDGVGREDFVPSPGLQCASCEFFNECRQWSGQRGKEVSV